MECIIRHKHTLKILYKLKQFQRKYKRECDYAYSGPTPML